MHHSTKRRVVLGMTTGGLLVGGLGMGIAQADTTANGAATNSPGLLSGNLIQIPINAPINVCGNSISVIGILDTATGNTCANSGSAGTTANGGAKDSPGAGSGNLIQVPINAPVNVCGNSASGVGIGDSASGNTCTNGGGSASGAGSAGSGSAGSTANGGSKGSPGVGSGNTVQLPVNAPVNLCGNSVSVIGIGDTASDNTCSNGTPVTTPTPPCGCHPTTPTIPPSTPGTPPTTAKPHSSAPHASAFAKPAVPGTLAETGSGASHLVAPLGAGMLGGSGLLLRKRVATLHHQTHRGR